MLLAGDSHLPSASVAKAQKPKDKRGEQHAKPQNRSGALQIMGNRFDVGDVRTKIKPC
jgi:hypothetical protein